MFAIDLTVPEHICQACNRNTSGTERLRVKRGRKFIASMHVECVFDIAPNETVIAESVPLKKKIIKVKQNG